MARTAVVVEVDASKTVVRTLGNCNVGEVPLTPMNPRGQEFVTITIPKYEVDRSADGGVDEVGQFDDIYLGRHIQIFEDGITAPIFEGVPMKTQARSGDGAVTIPVYDLGWYFTKTNITAQTRNLLSNGDFESGTTDWTASGSTMTSATDLFRRGSKALRLVGAATFAEQYAYQDVVVTGTAVGTALTVAGHFNIESWTGPAIYSRGLYVESIDSGVVETFNDRDGVIDDDTALALDEWQRVEATIWVPPNATRTIRVRLYAPNGSIVWDSVELVEPSSLAIAPGAGEDVGYTANRLVQFGQDPTYGKSDKQIGTTTAVTTGTVFTFPKAWQYVDKTPLDTALGEIVALGVFDYSIELTATGSTFTGHTPSKGSDLTASVTLTFPAPASPGAGVYGIASYEFDGDNDAVETDSTILGDGDGPDREEGHASDTSVVDMVLEGVDSAAPGTTIDMLDPLAAARLDRLKRPVESITVVTKGAVPVETGDRITLALADGVIDRSGTWRVVSGKRIPKTSNLSLTLNPYF